MSTSTKPATVETSPDRPVVPSPSAVSAPSGPGRYVATAAVTVVVALGAVAGTTFAVAGLLHRDATAQAVVVYHPDGADSADRRAAANQPYDSVDSADRRTTANQPYDSVDSADRRAGLR